ncbi:MAG: NADH:flavin oxidoreductase [Planctomycetota bacterium]
MHAARPILRVTTMPEPEHVHWHDLPDTTWPDADSARASLLFGPIDVGPLRCRTRTWVPAMVPWRATEDGEVTDDVIDWYTRFAQGLPGVLVVEATGIRDVPSGPLLRASHARFVPGLRRLVDAVRDASGGRTRLLLQIIDFLAIRRRPQKERYFTRFLRIGSHHAAALATLGVLDSTADESAVRGALVALDDVTLASVLTPREFRDYAFGYREQVGDTHLPHVAELPRVLPGLFADAAERACESGFDGVELHYAHAYTMASFLSRTNQRDDGYGGAKDHRVRLPLEVFRAVRARVGERFAVGCRMLGDEVIRGGSRIDDAVWFAREFARAGFDFVSVSKGGRFEDARQPQVGEAAYPYTGPSGHECMPHVRSDERGPFGRNLHLAAAIRGAIVADGLHTPVVGAGGIATFARAEAALRNGECDIVAAARQSLADPDWWLKVESGCGEQVRRCKFTNYCEGLDQRHKQVTCQLWDRDFADDPQTKRSNDGKRRLVAPPWQRP